MIRMSTLFKITKKLLLLPSEGNDNQCVTPLLEECIHYDQMVEELEARMTIAKGVREQKIGELVDAITGKWSDEQIASMIPGSKRYQRIILDSVQSGRTTWRKYL